jgi:hypothetical protein
VEDSVSDGKKGEIRRLGNQMDQEFEQDMFGGKIVEWSDGKMLEMGSWIGLMGINPTANGKMTSSIRR